MVNMYELCTNLNGKEATQYDQPKWSQCMSYVPT